jgi:hypothetical protein
MEVKLNADGVPYERIASSRIDLRQGIRSICALSVRRSAIFDTLEH